MKHLFQPFLRAACIAFLLFFQIGSGFIHAAASPLPDSPGDFVPGQVVVALAEGATLADVQLGPRMSADSSASSGLAELNIIVIHVPPGKEWETALTIQRQADVLFAEPNYLLQADFIPNDSQWSDQYAPAHVNAPAAWDVTTGSRDVVLAILDSGIDLSHPEFAGRLLPGYDFVDNDTTPQDGDGHGTHVTGIAAATGNNNQGIAGIDWQSRILPVRILNNFGSGTTVNFAKGILYAIDHQADVINLSLGTSVNSSLLEYSTYYAYQKGISLIASSGNFNGPVSYPAAYPWVLAVGATNDLDQRWSSSNYGPQLDLVAPGVGIYSTGLAGSYYYETGTSMAAPLAAGTAALLAGRDGFTTPDRIYAALTQSASQYPARDDFLGYGLLRVDAALAFDPSGIEPPTPPATVVEYDVLRSSRCENISMQWREIPHVETAYSPAQGYGKLLFTDSYSTLSLPAGFEIRYAGIDYTQLTVNADGWLGFDGPYSTLFAEIEGRNDPIPTQDSAAPYDRPDVMIAPFWDDLAPHLAGGVYAALIGSAPNREWVVEWQDVPLASAPSASALTFQVIVQESSGEIIFNYLALEGSASDGASATIGLEFNQGQDGAQASYNQANSVQPGDSIIFVPYDPTQSSRSAKGCLYSTQSGPTGGFYEFAPFCLDVPAGLLSEDTTITLELRGDVNTETSAVDLGQYAQLSFDPMPASPFNPTPLLCYAYNASDLMRAGGDPGNLFLARLTGEGWMKLGTLAQTDSGRILTPIITDGIYGVLASPAPQRLPETGQHLQPMKTWAILLVALLIYGGFYWQRRE
ncbi:S8 family serine peptidase [Ornatilinea apprima]|uniref:S8 family serine peptidase n=1 Tax=Ornatilinea apprima TaxID=1134406 RepID=UPI00094615FC|nr:S8 family serine peptidase [Ornatilinea apprima]